MQQVADQDFQNEGISGVKCVGDVPPAVGPGVLAPFPRKFLNFILQNAIVLCIFTRF